jgi:hypothetical protein
MQPEGPAGGHIKGLQPLARLQSSGISWVHLGGKTGTCTQWYVLLRAAAQA